MDYIKILDNLSQAIEPLNPSSMITKATVKPNPFVASLTLDVMTDQSKHAIARMFDQNGRIVKMFSWYLVKGTNVTTLYDLQTLRNGTYHLDMIDTDGNPIFQTKLIKA